uniref:BBSome-interacting protein 1 n=1 Tax=Ditylenchus dipsaci TaxID=166011 RepID=A0A915DFF0_9BILA
MDSELKEVMWPPNGLIYDQEFMLPAFCKPKLIPLKSITLEKLEKMQQEAVAKLKEMEQLAANREEVEQRAKAQKDTENDADRPEGLSTDKNTTDIWQAD